MFLSVLILGLNLLGCSHSIEPGGNPDWVKALIAKFESDPVGNPPQSIWRYEYNGETVYYIPPQCCDQFSTLYDAQGSIICAPDGGFTGGGDGRCPDFFEKRSGEKLIWKDSRIP
jgi:hypothetical protein